MTPESVHRDVGAYALGVLDPRDNARFEEHLAMCHSCPRELEQLSTVAALLSHVDAGDVVFAERSTRDPRRSDVLVGTVRSERRRSRVRQRLTLAACVLLLGAGAGVVATGQVDGLLPVRSPAVSAAPKLHAVSQNTGTEATVQVDGKRWGSQVTLQVTHVKGPLACRLVAVSKDGQSEVVMGWSVPPEGYGTKEQPDPLVLVGGTDLPPSSLARLEVRTVSGALLVSVPA
jgi:anti-sigma factor RsiW